MLVSNHRLVLHPVMSLQNNFTPGPSQLYFTVEDHTRKAFREGIPSLSHRTKEFETIFQRATQGLRELLTIPDNFYIVFTSSATEIWERIIQNCAEAHTHHLVNGAFSKRFYETAKLLGRKASQTQVPEGQGFSGSVKIPATELIAVTHNETSTGVSLPKEFINGLRKAHPSALIAVDAVSSLPFPKFDFSKIDTLFFSVQKGFGLPAGLGVWILNDRCLAKAQQLHSKGVSIGSYHSLPVLIHHAKKNQTPETPNVLGIYLLAQVVEDMLRRGISAIRNETEYKAAILYNELAQNAYVQAFVKEKQFQSKTVIVADCGSYTGALTNYLHEHGLHPGEGYGSFKKKHLRFANFPTHSKEQFEKLVDAIADFKF
jgi:phosphoserine aminotransferase